MPILPRARQNRNRAPEWKLFGVLFRGERMGDSFHPKVAGSVSICEVASEGSAMGSPAMSEDLSLCLRVGVAPMCQKKLRRGETP